jgi:type II restriction/modification system DNA methylase subunit YeeA
MENGGDFDLNDIAWFNGGLFDGRRALPLDEGDIGLLIAAGSMDWSLIDPSIFGTLFERFLDPDKRTQIGAHYTDREKINRIIEPVIFRPLLKEWLATKQEIEQLLSGKTKPPMRSKMRRRMTTAEAAEEIRSRYLERLRNLRILDPACGSGNFLYLALQGVKDIENRANLECEMLGLQPRLPIVGPEILRGIEINPLAAELARTTIWIGDIQWRLRNGIHAKPRPILRKLDSIECRNALVTAGPSLLNENGSVNILRSNSPDQPENYIEAEWPSVDFIVGNPPFLGIRLMRAGLGDMAVKQLFDVYAGRVSREADLVCYWFEKARAALSIGQASQVGLVATNSIRGGANRKVIDNIASENHIFDAWSDEPWVVDGASVRVSLICFARSNETVRLNGKVSAKINTDLTAGRLNFTRVLQMSENLGIVFMGDTKGGAFDVAGEITRCWLRLPLNPNGRPNSDVLRPWRNGIDITRRSRDMWLIDFGWEMSEREAALYDGPFQHIKENVFPERSGNRREAYKLSWWRHVEPRPALRTAMRNSPRYVATARVAKHRVFVWLDSGVVPDSRVFAFIRSDDTFFGILHSRFHEAWTLRTCSWHGVGNDPTYNSAGVFETFAFPEGLTPNIPAERYVADPRAAAISVAAKRLNDLRDAWLNPPDLVRIETEVVPGYPARILPKDTIAAETLRDRTLTNLYNQHPQWLVNAHRDLDAAVAAAYGWSANISEEDALSRLLELNLSRAAASEVGAPEKAKRKLRRPTPEEMRSSLNSNFQFQVAGRNKKALQQSNPHQLSTKR